MDILTSIIFWFGVIILTYYFLLWIIVLISDCNAAMVFAENFGKPISALNGKVIWITGASSGIGENLAKYCAKAGSKLILSARRRSVLEDVKRSCIVSSKGKLKDVDVLVLPMDISETDQHQTLFDQAMDHFGKLDILVNNAGKSQRAKWEDIEIDVDRTMFDLNVFGLINLTRICIKYFTKVGRGHVAVTSSGAGLIGLPYAASYTATKHAIHGYFNSLRNERLDKNLSVTVFCPGPTVTNFFRESFTEKLGEKCRQSTQSSTKRMTGKRCGYLFAVALANKVDEAWVAVSPIVFVFYLYCYFPNLFKWILKIIGRKALLKLRDNRVSMKVNST